jgi:hypothetical protein
MLSLFGAKLKTKVQGFGDFYIGYIKPKQWCIEFRSKVQGFWDFYKLAILDLGL